MIMLRDLNLKPVYYSEDIDIIKNFYIPVLGEAVQYDRAAGYFSSSLFFYISEGLSSLIQNKGRMRLLIGTPLNKDETEAVLKGYESRELIIMNSIKKELEAILIDFPIELEANSFFWKRASCLSWLIQQNFLDIKVAIRRNGIFHEKIGIVYDNVGDSVLFQGSANETLKAIHIDSNYESLNVFKSWIPEFKEHMEPHVTKFERLWSNTEKNTLVIDFPEAAKKYLLTKMPLNNEPLSPLMEITEWDKILSESKIAPHLEILPMKESLPTIPTHLNNKSFKLKHHQIEAIKNWHKNSFRGIMELCTGSGKTITAIYALVRLFQTSLSKRLFVVICVPYINLAQQWVDVLSLFNIYPTQCFDDVKEWNQDLQDAILSFNMGMSQFQCVVVVNKTMKSKSFQDSLKNLREGKNFLWIGDEVHHHDTDLAFNNLPVHADIRLGLSATVEGCDKIHKYYGETVAKYGLEDAIKDGVLCNYEYYPTIVNLTREEIISYIEIEKKLNALEGQRHHNPSFNSTLLDILYSKRNDLLGNAFNKTIILSDLIAKIPLHQAKSLFYCSSTILNEDSEVDDSELRQIDRVVNLLHQNGFKVSKYTSRESKAERTKIMDYFKSGDIHCLVAIRCLDEGVDIPSVDTAFLLASSSNSKQFVQRRGRVLRNAPGKEIAKIYDLVVTFEPEDDIEANFQRKLLESELKRVKEFASLAVNFSDAWTLIKEYSNH